MTKKQTDPPKQELITREEYEKKELIERERVARKGVPKIQSFLEWASVNTAWGLRRERELSTETELWHKAEFKAQKEQHKLDNIKAYLARQDELENLEYESAKAAYEVYLKEMKVKLKEYERELLEHEPKDGLYQATRAADIAAQKARQAEYKADIAQHAHEKAKFTSAQQNKHKNQKRSRNDHVARAYERRSERIKQIGAIKNK